MKKVVEVKKVVIVGTGIVGATTAYELAKRGLEVIMVDRNDKGRATTAAAGMISPWMTKRRNKAWYALATKGAAYYEKLINNLSADGEYNTGYKKVGALRLHTDEAKLMELKKIVKERRKTAPEIGEILLFNQKETNAKFPLLNSSYYSLFISGAARVDGKALNESLIRATKKHGATFIEGEAQLIQSNNTIAGVRVNEEQIEADITIATNGVWMPELMSPLGISLQISLQKGEIIHLHTNEVDTSSLPVMMPPNNQYLLNFEDGRIVIGSTHEKLEQTNTAISAGGIHYILDQALKVAPKLSTSTIINTRVGFRPYTPNHLPVFGPFPQVKRLLIANGLGASGLTTGPFIGNQLAKIVTGETVDVPLENYNIEEIIR